jgi:hypothetical protein
VLKPYLPRFGTIPLQPVRAFLLVVAIDDNYGDNSTGPNPARVVVKY